MTARKTATPTVDPVANDTSTDRLADLRAQQKALRDQIKALETATKRDTLATEIARQEQTPNLSLQASIAKYVRARIRRGQPAEDAVTGVLALCERIARAALATPEPTTAEATDTATDTDTAN